MHVCVVVCVCVCTYKRVYMHVCVYVPAYVYVCAFMNLPVCACVFVEARDMGYLSGLITALGFFAVAELLLNPELTSFARLVIQHAWKLPFFISYL